MCFDEWCAICRKKQFQRRPDDGFQHMPAMHLAVRETHRPMCVDLRHAIDQALPGEMGDGHVMPAVQREIIDGVADEAAGRSIAELAAERDRCLIAVLDAVKQRRQKDR